jgi:hypothetical protein
VLVAQGWRVVRIWEHEKVPEGVARILAELDAAGMPRRAATASGDAAQG